MCVRACVHVCVCGCVYVCVCVLSTPHYPVIRSLPSMHHYLGSKLAMVKLKLEPVQVYGPALTVG